GALRAGVGALDFGDAYFEVLVPLAFAALARRRVLFVVAPAANVFLAVEIGDGDAEAVFFARAVGAEESRLLLHELEHALGRSVVVGLAAAVAPRGEDHRVVRRLRRLRQSAVTHPR